jgi:uncharacterized protein YukE
VNVNDYAPGSPQGIRQIASQIGETGNAALEAQREMQAINGVCGDVKWEGGARNSFADYALDLPADLGRMAQSYTAVSDALSSYAWELEDVRNQVNQALARYQVAESRKNQAEGEVSRAATRLNQLRSQLRPARVKEAWTKGQYELASLGGHDPVLYEQYLRARNWRNRLEADETAEEQVRHRHQVAADSADGDMRSVAATLGDLREQRHQAEDRCRQRIDAALEGDLKNRSWWEKTGDAVVGMAKAVWDKDFGDFVFHLRESLGVLSEILHKLSLIVLVVGVVAAIVVAFVLGPLVAAGVLFLTMKLVTLMHKGSKILAAGRLATGTFLSATGHRHPRTGSRSVTEIDVLFDSADLVLTMVDVKAADEAAKNLGKIVISPQFSYKNLLKVSLDQVDPRDLIIESSKPVREKANQMMNQAVDSLSRPTQRARLDSVWDGRRPVKGPVFAN